MIEIGVVSPGVFARALAESLPPESYRLGPVVGETTASARKFVRDAQTGVVASLNDLTSCSITLIGCRERRVAKWFAKLAAGNLDWTGKVVLNVSGRSDPSTGARLLQERGAAVGGLFPLQAFQRKPAGLAGVHFVLSGDPPAVRAGRALVRALGAEYVAVDHEQRNHAAVALSVATDAFTAILDLTVTRLMAAGFPRKRAVRAVRPVLDACLEDYALSGSKSKPGPLLQGDVEAVAGRLETCALQDPAAGELYRRSLQLALAVLNPDAEQFGFLDRPTQRAVAARAGGRGA